MCQLVYVCVCKVSRARNGISIHSRWMRLNSTQNNKVSPAFSTGAGVQRTPLRSRSADRAGRREIERVMGELLTTLVFPLLQSPFLNPAPPAALAQKRRARLPSSDRCAGASAVLAQNCMRTSTLDRSDVLFFQIILSMIDCHFRVFVLSQHRTKMAPQMRSLFFRQIV